MNEKTEQLLQSLADKLGTTTEYLWTILVNQAKFDVIVSLIQMAFMAAFYCNRKIHFKLVKELPTDKNDEWNVIKSLYGKYEEAAGMAMKNL